MSHPVENTPNLVLDSTLAYVLRCQAMKRYLTVEQVRELMRKRQAARTQREFAIELGITQQYLCDIYKGRREPGEQALQNLGINRRIVYELVS